MAWNLVSGKCPFPNRRLPTSCCVLTWQKLDAFASESYPFKLTSNSLSPPLALLHLTWITTVACPSEVTQELLGDSLISRKKHA